MLQAGIPLPGAHAEEVDGDGTPTTNTADFAPVVRQSDVVVFVVGVLPFIWATGEFWRRVLRGEVFGTGRDSVVIPKDFGEQGDEGGGGRRRVLTSSALTTAWLLFAIAGASVAIALVVFFEAQGGSST